MEYVPATTGDPNAKGEDQKSQAHSQSDIDASPRIPLIKKQ